MVRRQLGRITIGIMLMAGCVLGQTNSPSASSDLLRQAYRAVVNAELARSGNKTAEAVQSYREALGLFGRLQAEYPGWQGDAVGFRVADCQNALAKLDPVKTPDDKPVAGVGQTETNAAARLARLVQELETFKNVLATGLDTRGGGTAEAAVSRELDRVRAERDEAERANQSLLRRVARLEARVGRGLESASTNQTGKTVSVTVRNEARRLMESGDNAGALKLLQEARVMFPGDADLLILLGVAACQSGRFDDAVTVLKPLDVPGATQANALLTLGTAYMGMGRVGDARVATEKALTIDAQSPEANYNMAQILLSVSPSDPVAAQQYYRRAMELGLPADADLENSLRMALIMSRIKRRTK
jgi:Flp pilus assembly protein TadD